MNLIEEIKTIDTLLAPFSNEATIDLSKSNWMEQAAVQSRKRMDNIELHMVKIRSQLAKEIAPSSGNNTQEANRYIIITINETLVVRLYLKIPLASIPKSQDDIIKEALFLCIWDGIINDGRDTIIYIHDLEKAYGNEQRFFNILDGVIRISRENLPHELIANNIVFQTYSL